MFACRVQIFGQANSSLKRWLLDLAFRRKEAEMLRGIVRRDSIWDRLIFRKVQVLHSVSSITVFTHEPQCLRVSVSTLCILCFLCGVAANVVCCPLQASLGGRVRLMITGAAPISPTVLTFLRAAVGCQVSAR